MCHNRPHRPAMQASSERVGKYLHINRMSNGVDYLRYRHDLVRHYFRKIQKDFDAVKNETFWHRWADLRDETVAEVPEHKEYLDKMANMVIKRS